MHTKNPVIYLVLVCLLLVCCFAGAAMAASDDVSYASFKRALSTNADIPWNLEADSVYYDRNTDTYAAQGDAVLSQLDKKIKADSLIMKRADMQVIAEGHVELFVEDDYLSSDYVEVDLNSETGFIKMGYIFIRQNNFHINGENISKTGPYDYRIEEGVLTSCDGPDPDWRFESRLTEVTVDGYGQSWDTYFYVGNIPVLYLPYFAFPVKRSRQSGFLMPQSSISDRQGFTLTIPFYWAIDEHQDATFYAQYMTERGLKLGGEYRYDFGDIQGAVQADGMHDIRVDKSGTGRYGYDDGDNDYPRTNKDRFWIRGVHKQELPANFKLTINIDYVSDQDYLRDFRGGYMGYTNSKKFFQDKFNWDLEGKEDFVRTNKVLVNRNWAAASFNAQMVWFDNIIARRNNLKNFTVQELPIVNYTVRKQKIGNFPLFFTLDSEYGHFWREDGPTAQRVDIHPRFYAPINLGIFTLEPSIGLRETYWYQYGDDLANADNKKNSFNRAMLDTRTRLSSQFNRVYDMESLGFTDVSKVRHSITPEIIYDYVPTKKQDDLPYYTNIDRISNRNQVFASLTTTFTSKVKITADDMAYPDTFGSRLLNLNRAQVEELADPDATYRYLELVRINIKQGYDFNATQDGEDKKKLMPFYGSIRFMPIEGLRLGLDGAWSFNRNTFVSRNFSVSAWDKRGDAFFLEWRNNKNYDDPYNLTDAYPDNMLSRYYIDKNSNLDVFRDMDNINTLYTSANIRIMRGLDLFGDFEYNFADHTRVETNLGLRYSEQCWSVELGMRDEKDGGYSVGLFFTLLNIGDIGF